MGIVISKNRIKAECVVAFQYEKKPKVSFILWEDQSAFQPFCTTKVSNTLLANFLSYIAFFQAHKLVTLQYNEPLQV
jgi:hypothetical protein